MTETSPPLYDLIEAYLDTPPASGDPYHFDPTEHYSQLERTAVNGFLKARHPGGFTVSISGVDERPETVARGYRQLAEQYAKAQTPFGVVFSLNYLLGYEEHPHVEQNRRVLAQLGRETTLPAGWYESNHGGGALYGEIKGECVKMLLHHLRRQYRRRRNIPDPFVLFSEDIDVIRQSPHLVDRLYRPIREEGMSLVQANMLHARATGPYGEYPDSGVTFPNMDSVMWWYDLRCKYNVYPFSMHDSHHAVSLRTYLETDGFRPEDHNEGIAWQWRAIKQLGSRFRVQRLRGGHIITSARAEYWDMQRGISPFSVLSPPLTVDGYRSLPITDLYDLDPKHAQEMIDDAYADRAARYGDIFDRLHRRLGGPATSHELSLIDPNHRLPPAEARDFVDRRKSAALYIARQAGIMLPSSLVRPEKLDD